MLTRQGKKDVEVAYKRLSFQLGRAQGKKIELAAKLKEQSAELASKLEGLAQQHASDLASLQAAHEEKVRKMANAHEKGIERASVVHDKEMEKLEKPLHRPPTPTNLSNFTSYAAPKPPRVVVISIPLTKCSRMRCLTPQIDEVQAAKYGRLCLLALLSMYWLSPYYDQILEILHFTS